MNRVAPLFLLGIIMCQSIHQASSFGCFVGKLARGPQKEISKINVTLTKLFPADDFKPRVETGFSSCYNLTFTNIGAKGSQINVFGGSSSGCASASCCEATAKKAFFKFSDTIFPHIPYGLNYTCCHTKECNHKPSDSVVKASKYVGAQFIGFNIGTFPYYHPNGTSEYLGNKNVTVDLTARLQILESAMESAYARKTGTGSWSNRTDILKVFMTPEFFFRGATGAYNVSDIGPGAFPLGQSLINLTRDAKWADWLFVFGTVVVGQNMKNTSNNRYFNFAPIIKGGNSSTAVKMIAFKQYVSAIDFVKARVALDPGSYIPDPHQLPDRATNTSNNVFPRYDNIPESFSQLLNISGWKQVHGDVIDVDGLRVGVEVCLDHRLSVLYNALNRYQWNLTVDLQLITSAGMSIASGHVLTAPGGPVFLVDGGARTEMNTNPFGEGAITVPSNGYNAGRVSYSTANFQFWESLYARDLGSAGGDALYPGQKHTPSSFPAVSQPLNTILCAYYKCTNYDQLAAQYAKLNISIPLTTIVPSVDIWPLALFNRVVPIVK